jgi:hypothetical protein
VASKSSLRIHPGIAGVVAAFAILIGCSKVPPLAAPVEPDRAMSALKSSLDAWKEGRKPDSLSGDTPPIVVQDTDWLMENKLLSYQVVGDGIPEDANLRVKVELNLRDKSGKAVTRKVTYIVGTDPKLTVFRAME